jgi:serine/threonine protein kinase
MDKYRKVKIVGKGSFGYAMLVQAVSDRKLYVMKVIDVSRMDRKQKEEALNEVHVLKSMRHPYIVTYRESFMNKSCLCIVMDYADGGDMYGKIAKQKTAGRGFSENQILDWFVQICLAMKHIHDRRILHRDLKTQNIFLTSKGEVKVGDFGIARVLQSTYDCAQTAIGTPYYLSPEICQEKPYNQKSDIWSLGCILYEMTTLRHAFDSNNMKGLVLKILRGSYPPIPPCYSENLSSLLVEMLQRDPARRPSVKKILEKDFLNERIASLLSHTVAKHELAKSLQKSQEGLPPVVTDRPPTSPAPEDSKSPLMRVSTPDNPRPRSRLQTPSEIREESKAETPDEEDYNEVIIQSLQDCLNRKPGDEDSYFEERPEDRVYEKFLTPDGPLPGIGGKDSIYARIEALRMYLEQQLGVEEFREAYNCMMDSDDVNTEALQRILGAKKMKYVSVIAQMIVCEEECYSNSSSA